MTNRTQSTFFFAIIFLFATGLGLLIFKNYNQYYTQQASAELETATTPEMPAPQPKKSIASSTSEQVNGLQTYINSQEDYQIMFPSDSTLATEDLNLGAAGHQVVKVLPPNASFINITKGSAFVDVCDDCGGYGPGVSDVPSQELVTINGTQFNASGFVTHGANPESGYSSEIYFVYFPNRIPHVEVTYGYESDNGKVLDQSEIDAANEFLGSVLATFKLTN